MDQERANYIKGAIQRAPGKRQIKPTAVALADFQGEEESDEDFNPEGGSDSELNSDEEGDGEDDDAEDMDDEEDEEEDESSEVVEEKQEAELVCSICLNFRKTEGDKLIQCDKCGVAVHETCYAVDDYVDEDASVISNFSTEPWFCEPCLYGYEEPPHCELCPRRFGAFKRADVGGKFVHLVCALYTTGVSFGDVDNLTAVSWQEIDYKRFGRKSCNACTSVVESRSGLVTCCEAGLCKQHYHISCAQRMGFLVDTDYDHSQQPSSSNDKHVEIHPHFILCKTHNAPELIQKKRTQYLKFLRQEERRMVQLKFKRLNNREEAKLKAQQKCYQKRMTNFKNVTVHMPSVDHKRQRMFHTSAGVMEGFAEKAELLGFTKQEFEESFTRLDPSELPQLAPAFTHDFIRFYSHRENVLFNEEKERLEDSKREFTMLEREEKDLKQLLNEKKERNKSGKQKEHADKVNAMYKKFQAFFKKMPIRFDRATEVAKKEEKVKSPPRKKAKVSNVYKPESRPQSSSANSISHSDISTPPPLTSVSNSRSASEGVGDHFLDERPVLIPMVPQNGELSQKSRSQRPKRVLKV